MTDKSDKPDQDQTKIPDDIAKMNFEEALKALEDIVGKLESGDVSLEDSIEMYTRGTHLKNHCQRKLKAAEEKIQKITIGEGSGAEAEPFEVD